MEEGEAQDGAEGGERPEGEGQGVSEGGEAMRRRLKGQEGRGSEGERVTWTSDLH